MSWSTVIFNNVNDFKKFASVANKQRERISFFAIGDCVKSISPFVLFEYKKLFGNLEKNMNATHCLINTDYKFQKIKYDCQNKIKRA